VKKKGNFTGEEDESGNSKQTILIIQIV